MYQHHNFLWRTIFNTWVSTPSSHYISWFRPRNSFLNELPTFKLGYRFQCVVFFRVEYIQYRLNFVHSLYHIYQGWKFSAFSAFSAFLKSQGPFLRSMQIRWVFLGGVWVGYVATSTECFLLTHCLVFIMSFPAKSDSCHASRSLWSQTQ